MAEAITGALETDLRTLSTEARRADGLASQLTGWLSGPEHPQIKEAAERAILRLRSFGAREDGLEHLKNSRVGLQQSLASQNACQPGQQA